MFHVSDGWNTTWQVRANNAIEDQIALLANDLAIIKVTQATIYKGFLLQIEKFTVLKNHEDSVINLTSEPITELNNKFYLEQLTKRGILKIGKFVRSHPQIYQ